MEKEIGKKEGERERENTEKENVTLTRANEKYAKEFEGPSETAMLVVVVMNVI